MKVSIIIPVYNTEKYLKKCLQSVFVQTFKELQIIVVNDGSTDNSEQTILEIKRNHEFLYLKKNNGGLASARNYGLKYVDQDSDYVFFLDSDDFLEKTAIADLLNEINGEDIVIGRYKFAYSNGLEKLDNKAKFKKLNSKKMTNFQIFDYFFGGKYGINACNKLYKIKTLKETGILFEDNSKIFAEDLLFNEKLLTFPLNIKIIDDITYIYYQNEYSITHTYKKQLATRYLNLLISYKRFSENDKRLLTYTLCNAINCSCAQCDNINLMLTELEILKSGQIKASVKHLIGLPWKYKIDYLFNIIFLKLNIRVLSYYQKIKNVIRK